MINQQVNILSSLSFHNWDDNQFRLTLVEFMNGATINLGPDRLAQLCECYKNFSLCLNNDPDILFFLYFENSSCEYFTKDSLNNMLVEEQSRLNLNCSDLNPAFFFLHMNFRGISNKSQGYKFSRPTSSGTPCCWDFFRLGLMIVIIFPILRVTSFCSSKFIENQKEIKRACIAFFSLNNMLVEERRRLNLNYSDLQSGCSFFSI